MFLFFPLERALLLPVCPTRSSHASKCLCRSCERWTGMQLGNESVLAAGPLWCDLYGLSFQSLDWHPGEGDIITPCPALLGSEPPWEQQKWEGSSERLPNSPDWQLSMASLQPLVPHNQGPVHRAGDECDPVPHAHGFRCSEDGTAAGPGAQ